MRIARPSGRACLKCLLLPSEDLREHDSQTDDLIPGYKYVYTLVINEGSDSPEEVNKQEYTLREGYQATESHPLK